MPTAERQEVRSEASLRLVQLDEVLGLPARAIEGVVNPFRRAVFDVGDDEAGVEPERGGFDAGDGAPLAVPGFGLVACFGIAAHDWFVRHRALGADRFRRLVDFLRQRLRTGQAEDVIDAVGLAPFHRLGSGVVAVASECDARPRPALTDMAHEPAQMSAHFDARRGLAGAQHDRDGTRALGVIDMDRQKAALVVMGVEERESLDARARHRRCRRYRE